MPNQPGIYRPDGTRKVALPDVTLHEWHIRPNKLPGPGVEDKPLASFCRVQDKNGATRLVLLNQQLPYLEAADPGDRWKTIRVNEAVEMKDKRKLRFGLPGMTRDAVVELLSFA